MIKYRTKLRFAGLLQVVGPMPCDSLSKPIDLVHLKEALDGRRKRRRVNGSGCLYNGVLRQFLANVKSLFV
jgi:hypothetical protein